MGVIIPSGGGGGGGGGTVNFSNFIKIKIAFEKYQATGNDFILIDNRSGEYDILSATNISRLCDRRFGIGADGLIMINLNPNYDFDMRYFYADGQPGAMCGNGARCAIAFVRALGMDKPEYRFLTSDGVHTAERYDDGTVSVQMMPVDKTETDGQAKVIDTGALHHVVAVSNVDDVDVFYEGSTIRDSERYAKNGVNVDFVQPMSNDEIYVRTYECGVDDETLSCGTGVVAAAIASAGARDGLYEFKIKTRGGELQVSFDKVDQRYENIWLTGPATFVFSGKLNL